MFKSLIALIIVTLAVCTYAADSILDPYVPYKEHGVIEKAHYIVDFNDHTQTPNWAVYAILKPISSVVSRDGLDFKKDPECPKSPYDSAYVGGGMDAGHFVPAEDMSFDAKAIKDTFLTSNCAPQWSDFNRGVWKRLETQIRTWANSGKRMVILTGAVYRSNARTITGLGFADAFYKVIYFIDDNLTLCYYFPHKESKENLNMFIVSIAELEKNIDHNLSREPYRQKGQRTIKKGAYTTSPEPANANKGVESPRDPPNIK